MTVSTQDRMLAEWLRWDPTPLGARTAWAMARVLAPLDAVRSEALREHAELMALEAGMQQALAAPVPALLADEPALRAHFRMGQRFAPPELDVTEPHVVWQGDWWMQDDGLTEIRRIVVCIEGRYFPGQETSWQGGESTPRWGGEGYDTLNEARQARELSD